MQSKHSIIRKGSKSGMKILQKRVQADLALVYATFGREHQIKKLLEECQELLEAPEDLEEIADVCIVALQLVLNCPLIAKAFDTKYRRLMHRMENEYYKKGE